MALCVLKLLLLALLLAVVAAQEANIPTDSCFSGITQLRRVSDACQGASKRLYPLTAPMDFSTDWPWDCLAEMLMSVEGCKISMTSLVNSSSLVPGFSCSWLEYQGQVMNATGAQVAVWLRPIPVGRYVLHNTNLSSWRASGANTITLQEMNAAITEVARATPNLPVSALFNTEPMQQLARVAGMFNSQLGTPASAGAPPAAAGAPPAAAAGAAPPASSAGGMGRRLLQQAEQQQNDMGGPYPTVAAANEGAGDVSAAPAAEAPVAEDVIVVGPEDTAGREEAQFKPPDWQARLADVYHDDGSPLYADQEQGTIVLFNNRRCNIVFEVVSGGALGVGTIDRSTVGLIVMPAIPKYQQPVVIRSDRQALATPTSTSNLIGRSPSAAFITLVVMLSVVGAALLGSLVYLGLRLFRAPKSSAAAGAGLQQTPFDDGVGRPGTIAMSPLEHQARVHGPSGGL